MYHKWDKWEEYNIKMRLKETAFRPNENGLGEGPEWTDPGCRSPYSD